MVGGFEGVNVIVSDFEITVEKLVYGGEGLGRLDGRAVLAPFVLPGERVRVRGGGGKARLAAARSCWKCWRPRRNASRPPAHISDAAAAATTSTRLTKSNCAAETRILEDQLRRIGKTGAAGRDCGGGGRAVGIQESRATAYGERRDRISASAVAQAVRDRAVPDRLARDQCGDRRCCARCPRDSRWPRFVRGIELFTNESEMQLNVLETEQPVARRFFDWCAERIPGWLWGALDYPAADINGA